MEGIFPLLDNLSINWLCVILIPWFIASYQRFFDDHCAWDRLSSKLNNHSNPPTFNDWYIDQCRAVSQSRCSCEKIFFSKSWVSTCTRADGKVCCRAHARFCMYLILCTNASFLMYIVATIMHPVLLAAWAHDGLVRIHPFEDGNGCSVWLSYQFLAWGDRGCLLVCMWVGSCR